MYDAFYGGSWYSIPCATEYIFHQENSRVTGNKKGCSFFRGASLSVMIGLNYCIVKRLCVNRYTVRSAFTVNDFRILFEAFNIVFYGLIFFLLIERFRDLILYVIKCF